MPYQYFNAVFAKKYIALTYALLAMTDKARKILHKGETFGAILTGLSKAFDIMTHGVLIAKLHTLNFDMNTLNLLFHY